MVTTAHDIPKVGNDLFLSARKLKRPLSGYKGMKWYGKSYTEERLWCLVPSRHGAHDIVIPASEDPCPGPKSSLNAEQTGEFVKHYVRCLEVPATP